METRRAAFELAMDHFGPRLKGYYCIVIFLYVGSIEPRRVTLFRVQYCYSCLPGTCDQVGKFTYVRNKFVILNK